MKTDGVNIKLPNQVIYIKPTYNPLLIIRLSQSKLWFATGKHESFNNLAFCIIFFIFFYKHQINAVQ